MSYKLTAPNTITVTWSLIGTGDASSYSVTGSWVETTPETLTFNSVGFGNAGFDASRISFSDVSISHTAIPEPAAAWLTGLLALTACIGVTHRLRLKS
ncbi:MAG: hypothetical protein LBK99_09525 [Opitutaceae bacterium]|jgi:hypothetical protein|nr:hypothetical protein [Opitutaceae bacterium]